MDSAAVVSNTPLAFAAPLVVVVCRAIAIVGDDDAGSMGGIAAAAGQDDDVCYSECQWQHFHYYCCVHFVHHRYVALLLLWDPLLGIHIVVCLANW